MDPERFGLAFMGLVGLVTGVDLAIAFLVASVRATSDTDDGIYGRD